MAKREIPPEIRQLCYERDNYACQEPGCGLTRESGAILNLHHIKPEQFGGLDIPSNLITLCDIHHKGMHIEFSAFYPDSQGVLYRMNNFLKQTLSKIRRMAKVDDGFDLKPYLKFLTNKDQFRKGQLEAIRAASEGRDVLFVAPTGIGKSICYQIPTLITDRPSLVISPLKALMKDQVENLWRKKIPATFINGDISPDERKRRYSFIDKKLYRFIFVAPERFEAKENEKASLYTNYDHFVVDEAHAVEMWGMAFRPAYRQLGNLRKQLRQPPLIALTATASKESQVRILEDLGSQNAKVIVTGFHRPNIEIVVNKRSANSEEKFHRIEGIIRNYPADKILIFTPTIKLGKELLDYLRRKEVRTYLFHSKLDARIKMRLQNLYTGIEKPELQILISTTAFGMGIDIHNIRHVIHLSPALSLTDYVQQIGRAGRDGQQARAHLLHDARDRDLLRYLAKRPLAKPGLQKKCNYSDEDMIQVEKKLLSQVDEMLELLKQPSGQEWKYIIDYFGETRFSLWQQTGQAIFDIILIVLGLELILIILLLIQIF